MTKTAAEGLIAAILAPEYGQPEVTATFSQRIERRARLWWDAPRPGSGRTLRDASHRLRERRAVRTRDDPDAAWRCCDAWPRTLVNKWNGREFAARHDCPLPDLYWHGGALSQPPLESFPDHFVVRPVRGAGRRGVLVVSEGRELLRDEPAGPEELRARLSPWGRAGRPMPLVVEEFVTTEVGDHQLPLELKCHTFGDTVAAIELLERAGLRAHSRRYYTPGWEPFPERMDATLPLAGLRDPPAGVAEMLAAASRVGRALGTYMRIDFFASAGRSVFNEFSTVPRGGQGFTPYCNDYFGALWEERCPGAI